MGSYFKLRGIYNSDNLYQFGKNGIQIKTDVSNKFKFRNAADNGDADISANQVTSTVAIGTAPIVVTSTTKVSNLNVDQVDGYDVANTTGSIPLSNGTKNVNCFVEKSETIYDQNSGTFKKMWFGTATQYNLLTPSADVLYIITGA